MTREQYVQYLRSQASLIGFLADEIENGGPVTLDWAVEWELYQEKAFLTQEYHAELDKAAEETGKEVA